MLTSITKVCPFCGSDSLGISTTTGSHCYYKAVYCKNCHTYGPRVRIAANTADYSNRYNIEHDDSTDQQAINKWNNRLERIKV